jgi:hypothetical protein
MYYLEVSGQVYAPAALPPSKSPRYPLDGRLGGPQSLSGRRRERKFFTLLGLELRPLSLLASRYTDYSIPASLSLLLLLLLLLLIIIIIIIIIINLIYLLYNLRVQRRIAT